MKYYDFDINDFGTKVASCFKREGEEKRVILLCKECDSEFESGYSNAKRVKVKWCKKCRHLPLQKMEGGIDKHPLYNTWLRMKQRCRSTNDDGFENYGGRGIDFEDYFLDSKNFIIYLESLPNYEKRTIDCLTIDRKDSSIGYIRGNLRWASKQVQAANRRVLDSNTSGYTGVTFVKRRGKFSSRIKYNNKNYSLGSYMTKEEAVLARNKFIIENGLSYPIQDIK